MDRNDKHMDGAGLSRMWEKVKAQFLAKSGGTLTGKLTISSGGLEVSGSSSRFHHTLIVDNGFGLAARNQDDTTTISLVSYSGNVVAIGYGNASVGPARIFGKSVSIYTNGWNERVTIGDDGNVAIVGEIDSPTIKNLASGIGLATALAQEHSIALSAQGNRIADLESNVLTLEGYFNGNIPTNAVSALSLSGVTINYSIGGVAQTGLTLPNASASAAGVVSTGTQTIAGVKTLQTASKGTPLILQNGYQSTSGANHTSIQFKMTDGTSMGYIGVQKDGSTYEPYFYDSDYRVLYHTGNANTESVNWKCLGLTAHGNILAQGNVSAVGSVSSSTLSVSGNATVGGTLSVTDATTLSSLGVTGNATVGGTLGVTGSASANSFVEDGVAISTKYTYTAGNYVDITNNAVSVKEASSSQGGVVTTGTQTFGGQKTFSNSSDKQIIIKQNSGGGGSTASLGFATADGLLGEIMVKANANNEPQYKKSGGTAYKMWHAGNSNRSDVNWTCNNLAASGDMYAVGGVAAGGICDLSIIQ